MHLTIDRAAARRHLALIDPAQPVHLFMAAPEAPGTDGAVRHLRGRLEHVQARLDRLQRAGYGIFVTVNAMHGRRRRFLDLAAVRALWIERDGPGPALPLTPSLVVETSPGKRHEYLLTDTASLPGIDSARRINRQIARNHGGDIQATDLVRVLRLAGSWHLKTVPHPVTILADPGHRYGAATLEDAFPEPPAAPIPISQPVCHSDRWLAAAINGVRTDLARAIEGHRNATLNRAAFRLARLGLDPDEIAGLLDPVAHAIGLNPREIAATLRSATRAGAGKRV